MIKSKMVQTHMFVYACMYVCVCIYVCVCVYEEENKTKENTIQYTPHNERDRDTERDMLLPFCP